MDTKPQQDETHAGGGRTRTVRLPAADVPAGGRTLVRSEGVRVAVFRLESGALHAVDDRCPHEGYPLSQGTVKDCVLTCPWHNYKFRLDDGACLKGDEAVRTFPVHERDGTIELAIVEPSPAEEIPRHLRSLEEGLLEDRMGQVARDTVRLLQLGMAPRDIALAACRYDAERAEFGTTHAMPVAVDVLPSLERYPGVEAVYPLMQALELCGEAHVRRPRRPVPDPMDPGPDPEAAGERLAEHIEAEEIEPAEALLRGALARGWGRETVEPWLYRACARHFLGFGHSLIYLVKVFDLLEAVGWEHAGEVLPAYLVRLTRATREELLPEWSWFRDRMTAIEPRLGELYARQGSREVPGSASGLSAALLDGERDAAFDALTGALEDGVPLARVVDALSLAAAGRLLRFDVAIDSDRTVQDGWLDVTHLLTYVNALRHAVRRYREPDVLRLVYFGVRFVHNARALDAPPSRRLVADDSEQEPAAVALDELGRRVATRDAAAAIGAVRRLVRDGRLRELRAFFEDLAFDDTLTRPIVVAHLIKTAAAAFEEFAALEAAGEPEATAPLEAVTRLAASPIRERGIAGASYEAIRFLEHGKVPRTLT